MVRKADIPKHIVECALTLAEKRGWRGLSLAEIAATAELPVATVAEVYPNKDAILDAFRRRLDVAALAGSEASDLDQPVKDRLFDVLMRRFDAMKPHRAALRVIARDVMRDPGSALRAGCGLTCSMKVMLEGSGVAAGGAPGLLRAKGLAAIYLAAMRVWLDDETGDSSATMAALDTRLAKADRLMASVCGRLRRASRRSPKTEAA
jgi:AcrR family transcriptional regulator